MNQNWEFVATSGAVTLFLTLASLAMSLGSAKRGEVSGVALAAAALAALLLAFTVMGLSGEWR